MDKFDLNPILVNINKLNPYQFLEANLRGLEAQIEKGRDGIIEIPR